MSQERIAKFLETHILVPGVTVRVSPEDRVFVEAPSINSSLLALDTASAQQLIELLMEAGELKLSLVIREIPGAHFQLFNVDSLSDGPDSLALRDFFGDLNDVIPINATS